MSPTEHDLRAALRDGEGDGPDIDRIVAGGRAQRAQRRTQALTAAAATVLVAGLGVGGTFLVRTAGGDGGGSDSTRGGARQYDSVTGGAEGGASAGSKTAAPSLPNAAKEPLLSCPESLPRYLLPPTAGDSGASLFSGPVARVLVCGYGGSNVALGRTPANPKAVLLAGEDAKALVDSLEKTAGTRPTGMCPDYRRADEQPVAIVGVDADGRRVGLVTTVLGRPACAVDVRNGKVVRYGWQPPERVIAKLAPIEPPGGVSHGPVLPADSPTK